jgi:cell division protease FtsH
MVCQFGMSRLGPISFGHKNENPFLGRDLGEMRNYSESIAHEIDMEISKIINTQYDLAKQLLVDHMDVFDRVANILLTVETLDSEEFLEIVNNNATLEKIREIQERKIQSGKQDSNPGSNDKSDLSTPPPTATETPTGSNTSLV